MSAQIAIAKLEGYAQELEKRSTELAETQRALDDVQPQYEEFLRDFEVDMYEKALAAGQKLPSEALRQALALKAMPSGFRNDHDALRRKRERLTKRISDLKTSVDAQRSLLSAEKLCLDAAEGR
jgi:hypothetical protein